jgi:protein-arginine kinase activator protein McsA
MKNCSRCKQQKSIFDFHKNSSKPDGLNPICKDCANEATRESAEIRKRWERIGREISKQCSAARKLEKSAKRKAIALN